MRVPPSQLGVHVADDDTAGALFLDSGGWGLVMGVDDHARPVTIMLFRREPTVAVAIGAVRFAQLIAFRALAVGAQVLVQTPRPTAWSTFARGGDLTWGASGTAPQRNQEVAVTTDQPQLLVIDSESRPIAEPDTQPHVGDSWSTVLTVRSQLSNWDASVVARADLALTQRLSAGESRLLCTAMNIPDAEEALTRLGDDVVALVSHSGVRFARIAQTTIERRLIGPLNRSLDV